MEKNLQFTRREFEFFKKVVRLQVILDHPELREDPSVANSSIIRDATAKLIKREKTSTIANQFYSTKPPSISKADFKRLCSSIKKNLTLKNIDRFDISDIIKRKHEHWAKEISKRFESEALVVNKDEWKNIKNSQPVVANIGDNSHQVNEISKEDLEKAIETISIYCHKTFYELEVNYLTILKKIIASKVAYQSRKDKKYYHTIFRNRFIGFIWNWYEVKNKKIIVKEVFFKQFYIDYPDVEYCSAQIPGGDGALTAFIDFAHKMLFISSEKSGSLGATTLIGFSLKDFESHRPLCGHMFYFDYDTNNFSAQAVILKQTIKVRDTSEFLEDTEFELTEKNTIPDSVRAILLSPNQVANKCYEGAYKTMSKLIVKFI